MPTSIPVGTSPAAVALIIAVPIAVAAVVLLVTLPLLGARIVITSDTISIKPSVLGSGVSFSRSDVKAMYVANLSEDRELQPTIRLWGASLMGYRYGWFKLANGHRAFLAIYGSS
ncbi:MAG: hypothetical protein GXO32_03840, partial [Crenarchaeota archaeon]|nr:hypothetical protein [Thermoproteota archaeon]